MMNKEINITKIGVTQLWELMSHRPKEKSNNKKTQVIPRQCDQRKIAKVLKSCPKMISLEKLKILAPTQKLPKTVGDLGKLSVAKSI